MLAPHLVRRTTRARKITRTLVTPITDEAEAALEAEEAVAGVVEVAEAVEAVSEVATEVVAKMERKTAMGSEKIPTAMKMVLVEATEGDSVDVVVEAAAVVVDEAEVAVTSGEEKAEMTRMASEAVEEVAGSDLATGMTTMKMMEAMIR